MESITLLIISLFNNSFCDNTGEIIKIDSTNIIRLYNLYFMYKIAAVKSYLLPIYSVNCSFASANNHRNFCWIS